jgi:hypothetical protein
MLHCFGISSTNQVLKQTKNPVLHYYVRNRLQREVMEMLQMRQHQQVPESTEDQQFMPELW